MPTEQPTSGHPAGFSDYLAAERTFLAWIRTGLGLMGFGFVIARFGIFLQQLQAVSVTHATFHNGLSLWFGTSVIVLGILVNIFAAWRHIRLVRELNRGVPTRFTPSIQALLVAFCLALIGLAMAVYLAAVQGSASAGQTATLNAVKGIDTPVTQTSPAP